MPYWNEDPTGRYGSGDLPGLPAVGASLPQSGRAKPGAGKLALPPGYLKKQQQKSFQDMINSDPIFAQLRDALGAEGQVDAAGRRSAIQRALINFGLIPDFAKAGVSGDALGFLQTDVDDLTRARANDMNNQGLSFMSRLNKANETSIADLKSELAARGILESGSTGYGLNQQAQTYKTSLFDAEQQLMDALMGFISDYTEGERTRKQRLIEGESDAADRAADDEPPDLDGEPTPETDKPKPKSKPKSGPNPKDLIPNDGGRSKKTKVKKRKPKPPRIGGV
jgi:hypothetical protein